jgi:hypothetical protein
MVVEEILPPLHQQLPLPSRVRGGEPIGASSMSSSGR